MLTFNFESLLEGLTTIKGCENAANSFLWYKTCGDSRWVYSGGSTADINESAYTSLNHHFSCKEGFYNGRFNIKDDNPLNRIQLVYFDILNEFPPFEHWGKCYIYSTQDQAGKVFRKSCITVRDPVRG
jgi:hypothetical protein